MKQNSFRLSTRIIIGAITAVVASAIMLLIIEEARLRDIYKSELRTDLEKNIKIEDRDLNWAMKELRQDVLFLSNTPPISGIVHATLNRGHDPRYGYPGKIWEERLQQIFSAYSATHPDYYQIRFIGVADGGREIVRVDNRGGKIETTPSARLQAKGDRDYFKATLGLHAGEVYLSEFNLNREQGVIEQPYRPTLRMATPVFTPGGQIFGMVVINMDVSRLLEAAASAMPEGVQAYITNMNGEYLFHPDAARSFGFELGHKDKITMDFPFLGTLFDPRSPGHFPLQAVAAGTDTQYWAAGRIHFDSGNPERFLLLAYYLPDAVIAKQITLIPPERIVIGFIVMLLAGGMALLVLRRMFYPLEQITVAADKIAAGNHDIQLPQTGSGEIGRLASALGIMLDKLLQREREILQANTALEARVSERTYELGAINELLHEEVLRGKRLQQETETLLQRNQALMQTSMDGIHVMDMQGNIVMANDAFCRMLGYSQEEIAGLDVADWDARFPAEELRARFEKLIGNSVLIESVHRRKDGTLIDVEISVSGIEIEGYGFIFASSRNITERNKAAAALRESEELLATVMKILPVGVWVVDKKGNIVFGNDCGQKIWAGSRYVGIEQFGEYKGWWLAGGKLIEPHEWAAARAIEKGEISFEEEIEIECFDGTHKIILNSVQPIGGSDGGINGAIIVNQDITERKQAELERLRNSDLRFRGTLEQAAVGIAHATLEGNFQQVNQKFCEIVGYTHDELMHMRFHDLTFPDDLDENVRYSKQLLATEISTFSMEKRYVRKDRSLVWVNLTVSLLRDSDGTPKYSIGVIEDITRRKELEEELHRSETKFRTVYESSSDAIMLLDKNGFFDCNETTLRIFGCTTRNDFIHKHPSQFSPLIQPGGQNSKSLADERIAAAFKNGSNRFEWTHCRLDGAEFFAEVLLTSMVLNGMQVLQATVHDITESKLAEQQLRDLSAHLQTVREEEKAKAAREIHDDLGGTLTGLKMDAYWLKRDLQAGKEMESILERIESMSGQLDNAVAITRRIITDLRPTMLDDLGLVAAIEWQAAQFRKRTGIECRVFCTSSQDCEVYLDKTRSINLFRIFQEALTNVARHSGASSVKVELERSIEGIIMSVSDNGCGLPNGHIIASSSYGIRGMCERVGQLGGKIKFDKPPGGGLSLSVILPQPADNEETS